MARAFTLQMHDRPPPWLPHQHTCPTCGEDYLCEDQGLFGCKGYVRFRPHLHAHDCDMPDVRTTGSDDMMADLQRMLKQMRNQHGAPTQSVLSNQLGHRRWNAIADRARRHDPHLDTIVQARSGAFAAVGSKGTVQTSEDGVNWTERAVPRPGPTEFADEGTVTITSKHPGPSQDRGSIRPAWWKPPASTALQRATGGPFFKRRKA